MIDHLKKIHDIILKSSKQNASKEDQTSIKSFIQCGTSLEEDFSLLVAADGFSFNAISKSQVIMKLLETKHKKKIPKSRKTIRQKVIDVCEKAKDDIRKRVAEAKKDNEKFIIMFDEWSQFGNKFLGLVLIQPNEEHDLLGAVPIKEESTADNIIELIKMVLTEYGLELNEDIIHYTTDGCNTMLKIGNELKPIVQQLCLAHGLHLAVIDSLYVKKSKKSEQEDQIMKDDLLNFFDRGDQQDDDLDESKSNYKNSNYDDHNSSDSDNWLSEDDECGENNEESDLFEKIDLVNNDLRCIYEDQLVKIRKVINLFRNSTTKNGVLQKYVKLSFEHELQLLLDCKVRWSSIFVMLDRFLKLKDEIEKALIDLKLKNLIEEIDFEILFELKEVLGCVKQASEKLSRRDVDITRGLQIFNILIDHLNTLDSTTAQMFARSIEKRLDQRTGLPHVVLEFLSDESKKMKSKLKSEVIQFIEQYYYHFFKKNKLNDEDYNEDKSNESDENSGKSLREKLDEIFENKSKTTKKQKIMKSKNQVKEEVEYFIKTGNKGRILSFVYNSLCRIRSSTVECERIFSHASFIFNKYRNRLDPDLLNLILILRYHFYKNPKKFKF